MDKVSTATMKKHKLTKADIKEEKENKQDLSIKDEIIAQVEKTIAKVESLTSK